jgi:hypothetical protein
MYRASSIQHLHHQCRRHHLVQRRPPDPGPPIPVNALSPTKTPESTIAPTAMIPTGLQNQQSHRPHQTQQHQTRQHQTQPRLQNLQLGSSSPFESSSNGVYICVQVSWDDLKEATIKPATSLVAPHCAVKTTTTITIMARWKNARICSLAFGFLVVVIISSIFNIWISLTYVIPIMNEEDATGTYFDAPVVNNYTPALVR